MKKIYFSLFLILVFSSVIFISSCSKPAKKITKFVDSVQLNKAFPEWAKKSNIYEVNIRQYTTEGTFKAFEKHLPRLKEMGVDILWLMPINPIGIKNRKGSLGSYYAVKNYKEINSEYGTIEDFKNLVKKIHESGMYVIVDWVANHTSWDNVWIEKNQDWYSQDSTGKIIMPAGTDWADVADLNYDIQEMRKAMIDAMIYWIKETGIDGYRCDVACWVPVDFWMRARKTIDSVKPNSFFLAECDEVNIHKAFDMTYSWGLKDVMNHIAQGKKNVVSLDSLLTKESNDFQVTDIRMRFTTNHDENTWNGTEFERLGNAAEIFTVLTYTIPGMPLMYSGQEEPLKKRLKFFDKDTIDWKKFENKDLFTKLNLMKKQNKALWNGIYGGELIKLENSKPQSVYSFIRQKDENSVVCIFNLSKDITDVKIMNEKLSGNYLNYFTGKTETLKSEVSIKLKPYEYIVLIKK